MYILAVFGELKTKDVIRMQWYNYVAESVATPLSGNAIVKSENLLEKIISHPSGKSLYHCYYDLEERDTFTSYTGLMRPVFDTVHIDLDSEADLGAKAWEDTKALCKQLQSRNVNFHVYFSGNKGFHVAIHKTAIGLSDGPKEELEAKVKKLLAELQINYASVDLRIWNANRKFRAYNSQHEKSGLYKIRLTGIGLRLSSMPIGEIRELAKQRQTLGYVHPHAQDTADSWLADLVKNAEAKAPLRNTPSLKAIPQGHTVDDDSLAFASFTGKKCTSEMLLRALPQFNRHDIALRLIYDLYSTGTPEHETLKTMGKWAAKIFGSDTDRAKDIERMVSDAYHKPQTYNFGCYDDVKKAYCSAKCKLFGNLSREKRAEPKDMTNKQRSESQQNGPKETEIVASILSSLPKLCVRSDEVFQWVDTHWKRLDREHFLHQLFCDAKAALLESATTSRIESVRRHVYDSLPRAPEQNHLFDSPVNLFNFQDGTYRVWQDDHGKTKIERHDHTPSDFLSYCSPFPLRGSTDLPRNGDFLEYLAIRRNDQATPELGEQTVRALKQALGAALMPYKPRTFFFVGESNSGKSTFINIMTKLVGDSNWCELDPCEKSPFALETAIGKTMSVCTELDRTSPLNDAMLKKARDRMPVFIQRKFKQNIKGIIPGLHVYACNELPPSAEGNTGALQNRFTVFEFKRGYLNGKSAIGDLAAHYWNTDSGTILEIAREGLEDLIANEFKYFVPDPANDTLESWQTDSDPIGVFIRDLRCGESVLQVSGTDQNAIPILSGGYILGSHLYEQFGEWTQKTGYNRKTTRHRFYSALRKKHKVHSWDRGFGGVRFQLAALSPQLNDDAVLRSEQVLAVREQDNANF